jgi:hypothetical protein
MIFGLSDLGYGRGRGQERRVVEQILVCAQSTEPTSHNQITECHPLPPGGFRSSLLPSNSINRLAFFRAGYRISLLHRPPETQYRR